LREIKNSTVAAVDVYTNKGYISYGDVSTLKTQQEK
jgi:hypothetical protein